MSDLKGLEISDIFGLSEPLTKLVETVSCGVGKLYEPTHIRRLAKAKAETPVNDTQTVPAAEAAAEPTAEASENKKSKFLRRK